MIILTKLFLSVLVIVIAIIFDWCVVSFFRNDRDLLSRTIVYALTGVYLVSAANFLIWIWS